VDSRAGMRYLIHPYRFAPGRKLRILHLEPGQSLSGLETAAGEESPDTTGCSAPGNRGRFRGNPELTDRVTENKPPDADLFGEG